MEVSIQQGKKFITLSGSTVIEEDDILIVLSDNQQGMEKVYNSLHVDPVDEQA